MYVHDVRRRNCDKYRPQFVLTDARYCCAANELHYSYDDEVDTVANFRIISWLMRR